MAFKWNCRNCGEAIQWVGLCNWCHEHLCWCPTEDKLCPDYVGPAGPTDFDCGSCKHWNPDKGCGLDPWPEEEK